MKIATIKWSIGDDSAVYKLSDASIVSLTGKRVTIDTGASRLRQNMILVFVRTASGFADKYMVAQATKVFDSGTIADFKIISGSEFTSGGAQDVIMWATDSIFNVDPSNIDSTVSASTITGVFNADSTFTDGTNSERGTITLSTGYTPIIGSLVFMYSWLSGGTFNASCIAELITTSTYRVVYGSNILSSQASGGMGMVAIDYPRYVVANISDYEVKEIARITDPVYGDWSQVSSPLVLDALVKNAHREHTLAYVPMGENTIKIFRGMTSTDPVFFQTAEMHYSVK